MRVFGKAAAQGPAYSYGWPGHGSAHAKIGAVFFSAFFSLANYMHIDPADYVRNAIRSVPNWPKPGITFRDITPVLQDPRSFRVLIDLFVYRYMRQRLDLVAGVDARGFILVLCWRMS